MVLISRSVALPVKSIISVRCKVLFQLVVSLLDLPTEVLQLVVQRIFQTGRVVGVHNYNDRLKMALDNQIYTHRHRSRRLSMASTMISPPHCPVVQMKLQARPF